MADEWWTPVRMVRMIRAADDDAAGFLIVRNALTPDEVRLLARLLKRRADDDIREVSIRVTVALRRLNPIEEALLRRFAAGMATDRAATARAYLSSRTSPLA